MINDLVKKTRSIRRFTEEPISRETLIELIDMARYSASAANLQPLKYIISNEEDRNNKIFPNLMWAGYLKGWKGPGPGERPSAYIIVMGDLSITNFFGCDHGIATQNIVLGASEKGLGSCIIGALNKKEIVNALNIPDRYEILHIIALGKTGEKVVVEEMENNGSVKYWRDDNGIHHVPKRKICDILLDLDDQPV